MKVLKICIGTWVNASHDKRELSICRELGADVLVVAKGDINGQKEMVDGFPMIRLSARPLGRRCPVMINRIAAIFSWAAYIRKMLDIDVISGHDLSGLAIGYLSNFLKKNKAKLVYDSHEFTVGRDELSGKLKTMLMFWLEHYLMKRCVFSVMVNDSIAEEVQRIHCLKEKPIVARNAAYYWNLDQETIAAKRRELNELFAIPENACLIMYHGAVAPHRGVEEMLRAAAPVENVYCLVLGNSETQDYIDHLQKHAADYGMADRVCFHKAVPLTELPNYVGAVDIGMINILASSKSFYYMLPNKFYENIQALTPVIVSDFPEVGRIVDKYGIGLKVDPEDIKAITRSIEKMKNDKEFYAECKKNLLVAKEELCWEKEKTMLKEAYRRILQ